MTGVAAVRQHGTVARYVDGCRCDDCTRVIRRYEKVRRRDHRNGVARTIPGWRVRRRVHALGCLGYSVEEMRRRLGYACRDNPIARAMQGDDVLPRSFEKFAALYDELAMLPFVPVTYADRLGRGRTLARAGREGWAPPLAWDDIDDPDERPNIGGIDRGVDQVVVQRILDGHKEQTTKAEKYEVTRRWIARGGSQNELERVTGWKVERYVEREAG